MTIGERIKEIRKKNGYTQGTLASGERDSVCVGNRQPQTQL